MEECVSSWVRQFENFRKSERLVQAIRRICFVALKYLRTLLNCLQKNPFDKCLSDGVKTGRRRWSDKLFRQK